MGLVEVEGEEQGGWTWGEGEGRGVVGMNAEFSPGFSPEFCPLACPEPDPAPEPEPEPLSPPPPVEAPPPEEGAPAPQLPVGGVALPFESRSGPGSGNLTFAESTVRQPFPIFAVNNPGRLAKATFGLLPPPPPTISTTAQFMYISRFPILLNHVHANTAPSASGVSPGTTNWNELVPSPGQPPS